MYCTRCGTNSPVDAMFCSGCGTQLPKGGGVPTVPPGPAEPLDPAAAAATPSGAAAPVPGAATPVPPVYYPPAVYGTPSAIPQTGPEYAGFWLRVVAYFVDSLVMMPLGLVGFALIGGTVLVNLEGLKGDTPDPKVIASLLAAYGGMILLSILGAWLYYALMESSRHQATLGKKAMGLIVTDLEGRPISFGRASGRFFGKMITGMTMGIGYAMAGFTERRQCLHDIIASTLVVKK